MEELQRHHREDVRLLYLSLIGICGGVIVSIALLIARALISSWS